MESEAVNSALKKQLKAMEEVMKSTNETQEQLQTKIHGLTKTVDSINQAVHSLFEKQEQTQTKIDGLKNTVESVNHMSQAGSETPKEVCQDLLEAAKSGDVNTVKILFKYSNDNCTDDDIYRNIPLTYAAEYGHVEVVRVLLEGGANVDRTNGYGRTALHVAAQYGHLDVCRLLLEGGADVDRPNAYGSSALQLASGYGHPDVCRLLLDKGANVDHLTKWNDTPLHYAARRGRLLVAELLVERGADVGVKGYKGLTASELARFYGYEDLAKLLDKVTRD